MKPWRDKDDFCYTNSIMYWIVWILTLGVVDYALNELCNKYPSTYKIAAYTMLSSIVGAAEIGLIIYIIEMYLIPLL